MKLITTGVTRIVLLTNRYAIKFPKPFKWRHFLEGFLANMNEKLLWQIAQIPDTKQFKVKEYFCPILWCSWGGWILIMPRLEKLSNSDQLQFEEISEKLKEICGDHKMQNYGKLGTKIMILDYAN